MSDEINSMNTNDESTNKKTKVGKKKMREFFFQIDLFPRIRNHRKRFAMNSELIIFQ